MTAADHLRRPNFLILGAPKCGTTALAQSLASHPDVFLSRPKEPHFFDCHYAKGIASYLGDHFAGWRSESAAGDATPSYLALPWVPRRVRATLPRARLIVVLRHPVERAYSSWWMFHARGMDRMPFEGAIRENELRLAERPIADDDASIRAWADHIDAIRRGDAIRVRTYLDSGYYARQIRRYLECFPREQLRVVFSDDLRHDGERTIRDLWRYLGVADDRMRARAGVVNDAIAPGASWLMKAAKATGLMRVRGLLPESAKAAMKRALAARGGQPPMADSTRSRLLAHFAPHVRELEELLAVDLSAWKQ